MEDACVWKDSGVRRTCCSGTDAAKAAPIRSEVVSSFIAMCSDDGDVESVGCWENGAGGGQETL